MKNKILSLLTIILVTANAGLCEQTRTVAVQDLTTKFIVAMVGVVVSSFVLYLLLAVYNKFRTGLPKKKEDILSSPKTTEDAIRFFINRNRLK